MKTELWLGDHFQPDWDEMPWVKRYIAGYLSSPVAGYDGLKYLQACVQVFQVFFVNGVDKCTAYRREESCGVQSTGIYFDGK